MSETNWSYCPICAVAWDAYNDNPSKCWNCEYEKSVKGESVKPEPIPDHCEAHPHYAAKGIPKEDCLTCWKMYRGAIDMHIKSIGE